MFENLGFLKSKFSIFTVSEYRKHGFIKVGEKNPRYPRHPRFRSGRIHDNCQDETFVRQLKICVKYTFAVNKKMFHFQNSVNNLIYIFA